MIIRTKFLAIPLLLSVLVAGCTLTIGGNKAVTETSPAAAAAAPVDADPLSLIKQGMRKKQVVDILGIPTLRTPIGDVMMPSAFQPEMWSYRGQGRIYFSGVSPTTMNDPGVVKVEVDPSERAEAPPPPKPYGTDD